MEDEGPVDAQQEPVSINALPDSLLGLVLAQVGVSDEPEDREAGLGFARSRLAAAASVSLQWRRLCFTQSTIWETMEVDIAWEEKELLAARAALLRRYSTPVQRVWIWFPEAYYIPGMNDLDPKPIAVFAALFVEWLQALQPTVLRELTLYGEWPVAVLGPLSAQLLRYTRLASLTVECDANGDIDLPAAVLASLPRLRSLRSLRLSGRLPLSLGDSLVPLTQLASLTVECDADGDIDLPAAVLATLPQLHSLRSLHLSGRLPLSLCDSLVPLTQLTHLHLHVRPPFGQPHVLPAGWWQRLQALPQLHDLRVDEGYGSGDSEVQRPLQLFLSAFPALREYMFELRGGVLIDGTPMAVCHYDALSGGGGRLRLAWDERLRPASAYSLQPVLAALLPRGEPPLRSLHLSGWNGSPVAAVTHGDASLAALRCLKINYCRLEQPNATLAALLSQVSGLTSMELADTKGHLTELPLALVRLTGLRRLELPGTLLQELPAGPYLKDLRKLDLAGNRFSVLAPSALATATALTHLSLGGQMQPHGEDWALSPEGPPLRRIDVDSVLLRLPVLRQLLLAGVDGDAPSTEALAYLRSLAPHLEIR